ncbi:hypothetical protein EDD18DRAFT_1428519 [Armillaria luteobubalina]|uniref:DUF6570 domain-containing protein n=1 Tax=Armillaria luteobubalina TaxID=153913 RepID=A0AA39PJC7_9AGAR|nr:hypothetical protein EDD18DRAFT_1428519 [Armillaria luteobubalina]
MIRPHRKEVIVDALRSVCPMESISSDLLRENRATISMFCSLLHGDAFQNFRDYLQDDLQPPTFPDGVLVKDEYDVITTPILRWLCEEFGGDTSTLCRRTREGYLRHLQNPQFTIVRNLINNRRINTKTPVFENKMAVVDILNSLPMYRASEILKSLYHIPTDVKHYRESFIQFCAILPTNIADAFISEVKKDFKDRIHYAKRICLENRSETETFLLPILESVVRQRLHEALTRTNNNALQESPCVVCARRHCNSDMNAMDITTIPNQHLLHPTRQHPSHILSNDMLLYGEERRPLTGEVSICSDCLRALNRTELPRLALANDMWLGHIPPCLEILTLPERILVARYFPAAYIIKLYPKLKSTKMWDPRTLSSGIKGNVSTYPLPHAYIASFVDGRQALPPKPSILSALIGVTFIQPNNKPQYPFPKELHVRRRVVFNALAWLKQNNPLWNDIYIDQE